MSGQKGDIYLGELGSEELLSPFGRKLTIADEEIGREQRTASGKLVKDIIATKKKFTLAYETIDGDALEQFLDIYDLNDELSLFIYHTDVPSTTSDESNYYDAYTVLMRPLSRERLLLLENGLWTGVSVELNEV